MFDGDTVFEGSNYRGFENLNSKDLSLYMKSCGIESCLPGFNYPSTARPGYHLHVVISGKGTLSVHGKTFDIHAGQMFVVKAGEETYYKADTADPWYYTWVTYDGTKCAEYMDSCGFTEGVYVQDCGAHTTEFLDISREIIKHPHLKESSVMYRLSLALKFLSLAMQCAEENSRDDDRNPDLTADDYVDYAVRYIESNYNNLKIADVAQYIGVNRTYFTSIFKKRMYMSPQDYLMQVRITRSKKLLTEMDVPIYVVAQSVGYEDQLTFSKMFKKKTGMSPEMYRKTNKN